MNYDELIEEIQERWINADSTDEEKGMALVFVGLLGKFKRETLDGLEADSKRLDTLLELLKTISQSRDNSLVLWTRGEVCTESRVLIKWNGQFTRAAIDAAMESVK